MVFVLEMKMYFSDLVDSRDNRGLRHNLADIIVMSIYAALCGYTGGEKWKSLHRVVDVHFREDVCKIKGKKSMQNLSLIRKICYNLMKLDKYFEKRKR